jgi:hypothetical protein
VPEEPDTLGVEWFPYPDRYGRLPVPLPRSLAHLKRQLSESKWTEARCWTAGRITGEKYQLPNRQHPDRKVADSEKWVAHQLRTRHALTGQYLQWTKSRPNAKCGWYQCKNQTHEHLLKNFPKWRGP